MNRYHWRLCGSVLGKDPRWHAENFARQPVGQILAAICWLNEHECEVANRDSYSTARLASLVLSAASLGKAESDHTMFLPFVKTNVPPAVVGTIQKLIKMRRLPLAVVAILSDDIRHTFKEKKG
jgi:hypothetical protein